MTRRSNIVVTHVAELIDHDTRTWDEELIRDLFWAGDAKDTEKSLAVGMMEDFS